jgi:glycerol-3-phosphate dehydrogenase (NAD(P)+)
VNERYLPGVTLPENLTVKRASELELTGTDLVVLGVPSKALPAAVGAIGDRVGQRTAVLMLAKGLVAPMGALPSDYVEERVRARATACLGGPAHAPSSARSSTRPVSSASAPMT